MIVCSRCGNTSDMSRFPPSVLNKAKKKGQCSDCYASIKSARMINDVEYAKRCKVQSRRLMRELNQLVKQPNHKRYVYGLVNPIDNSVFYVGSSISPDTRLKGHSSGRNHPKSTNKRKNEIVREVVNSGKELSYITLEDLTEEWASLENHWMGVLSKEFEIVNMVKNVV